MLRQPRKTAALRAYSWAGAWGGDGQLRMFPCELADLDEEYVRPYYPGMTRYWDASVPISWRSADEH
jgi:hypothetical protein